MPSIKLNHVFRFLLIAGLLVLPNAGYGQQIFEEIEETETSADAALTDYNQLKNALEYKIRERECDEETASTVETFKKELFVLDSLLGNLPIMQIPKHLTDNDHLIVDPYKEGDECIYATYLKLKYNKGCKKPAVLMEVDLSPYQNISRARKEGKLCMMSIDGKGYTQVDEIPDAKINKKTADMLLNKIERVIHAYGSELGVTYPQYQAYEKTKNIEDLKGLIRLRTLFLNTCKKKLVN